MKSRKELTLPKTTVKTTDKKELAFRKLGRYRRFAFYSFGTENSR